MRNPISKKISSLFLLLFLSTALSSAHSAEAPQTDAPRVELFSPQGVVKGTRQVTVRFSEPMVSFGDPTSKSPFKVGCSEPGKGRWVDGRNWVYDFEHDLPGGVSCTFTLQNALQSFAGQILGGQSIFTFSTGGPAILKTTPYKGNSIHEDQIFILTLDAKPEKKSVLRNVSCAVEGINEAIGIRIVTGPEKESILDAYYNKRIQKDEKILLQCKRNFPNDKKVRLIWGKGVKSLSGISSNKDQVFSYKVRKPFQAQFSCERENPEAGCIPFLPMTLSFSSSASLETAKGIRLQGPSNAYKPKVEAKPETKFIWSVSFPGPFPENTSFTLEIPQGLKDDAGRELANSGKFPLKINTASFPPLAKFSSRFGIIEKDNPVLPVTLRNIEPEVQARLLEVAVTEEEKKEMSSRIEQSGENSRGRIHRLDDQVKIIETLRNLTGVGRSRSLLASEKEARSITIPKFAGQKPMEVVGIPLGKTGLHIVEMESPILGAALLEKPGTMYVPTAALVTNLSAHFKKGRESSLVWVTRLDNAQPVQSAAVTIRNCKGEKVWNGITNEQGIASITDKNFSELKIPYCSSKRDEESWIDYSQLTALNDLDSGLFVFAEKGDDLTFVHSNWSKGIEPWRYQLPTYSYSPFIAHTVFSRTLLRAGETIHMKHIMRNKTMNGFKTLQQSDLPGIVQIWSPSGKSHLLPLQWDLQTGVAETQWEIPIGANLGSYEVYLERKPDKGKKETSLHASYSIFSGRFRVEEFRIPMMKGSIQPAQKNLVNVAEMDVDLQLSYLSGGGAKGLTMKLRSLSKKRGVSFPDFPGYAFAMGQVKEETLKKTEQGAQSQEKLQTQEVTLGAGGAARTKITGVPTEPFPQNVQVEMEFQDPNGEVQTISRNIAVYPSSLLLGIKPDSWAASKESFKFQVAALDLNGKPVPDVQVAVDIFEKKFYSHRKRLIGGFYSYEHATETKRIGAICQGKTGANGLLVCQVTSPVSGNVILQASAVDPAGNPSVTNRSVWIAGKEDWWFDVSDSDRIDLLPEKKRYEPGETATIQVRTPFRTSTALVSLEREGIMETWVQEISGKNPTIRIPIKANHAPNLFVSVLCVRGRVKEFKPTATIDLGRPAFKLGLTEIKVGWKSHELQVKVESEKDTYQVRETAKVRIKVRNANGEPLSTKGEIALAAVDVGLLELAPNHSWELLKAMMAERPYEVTTSTAQMQVVGKRHYGLKAVPDGGGGGKFLVRELFDTLLLWKGRIQLDEKGEALVEIPLNDSLTSFKIVAIANAGSGLFGTGSTEIQTTQELMLLSGLPEVVREGDLFRAGFTVRNSSERPMDVEITPSLASAKDPISLETIRANLSPGDAKEISWQVAVPEGIEALQWEVEAKETGGSAMDSLRLSQRVSELYRPKLVQATLFQLDGSFTAPMEKPKNALPGKGGLNLSFKPNLADEMGGVISYMQSYPYTCTEQRVSRAVVLFDQELWQEVISHLPTVMDSDGLLKYFPAGRRGSVVLTSYVLSISREGKMEIPSHLVERMEAGLQNFVEGKISRHSPIATPDLTLRKITALEALSRGKRFKPEMLDSITIQPNFWPTSTIIEWMNILLRREELPDRHTRLEEAGHILRSRLNFQGTTMGFSTEKRDNLWWLMVSNDVNAVRTILTLIDLEDWKEDLPRLVRGALGRQVKGRWDTTVANAWGTLALEKFSEKFESHPVTGISSSILNNEERKLDWLASPEGSEMFFNWPQETDELQVTHHGEGKPWLTMQSIAAIPLQESFSSGYAIKKTILPVEQKQPGKWSQGDVARVRIEVEAQADMTWVALNDPIPAGATILGTGLGRDSQLLTAKEKKTGWVWPLYEERSFEAFRAYYNYVPKGKWSLEYTIRLNNAGVFKLPETRVEALYAPEMFGATPNETISIEP